MKHVSLLFILTLFSTLVLGQAPTTQASFAGFSDTTCTSVKIAINKGNGTNRLIFATTDTSNFVPPVDGQPYSPSSSFGTNKAVAPGLYCVYNGASGNPFKLSRLKKSTVYYLQIFEYNKAPKPVYLRSITSGNYDSVSTTYITAALSSPNFKCYQKDFV